jgi:hypothetical protein
MALVPDHRLMKSPYEFLVENNRLRERSRLFRVLFAELGAGLRGGRRRPKAGGPLTRGRRPLFQAAAG